MKQFDILGKRRFERVNGNTYHSTTISVLEKGQRKQLAYIPFQYGYGDQYTQTGIDWLEKNGHIKLKQYENGHKESPRQYKKANISYRVQDEKRKKDL